MEEKISKTILRSLIVISFIAMLSFFLLDIFEVLKNGLAFGFIFGFVGTLLQTVLYWAKDRFKAMLQLFSAFIFVVAVLIYFL